MPELSESDFEGQPGGVQDAGLVTEKVFAAIKNAANPDAAEAAVHSLLSQWQELLSDFYSNVYGYRA